MWFLLMLFALLAGMALPAQFSINAVLRSHVVSPYLAAMISFFIGTCVLLIVTLSVDKGIKIEREILQQPWWIWTGGALGALYVLATIILIPKLGAANTIAYILTGQVVMSIIIDHYGLIKVPVHEISAPRIGGALLIIIGVILVQKF
ncbi:DMT family transporter [Salipaludibacillus agaradhaerens]|uniref:DMT family transporter n=1 Tax=Salipaludibacillus agaradhaerens TaxID=76935 RepID=A0A9Q4B545_SALAG|nr:DMT family transporter [Salipaludibacillus agaradhaerens]MCR6098484.1 DMT family transporter [Salipaludibacillus agaradhaerens]MCR6115886.1 DMT family transporter [Salipaludibacillus agaradhaerens]